MSKSIVWTLQNKCPFEWIDKFDELQYSIHHQPLIQLTVNNAFSNISEIINQFPALIISSQFSAQKISKALKNKKHNFYTVGMQAATILKNAGYKVLYISEDSQELAKYLLSKSDEKVLHLCSEKSNISLWPKNVDSFPFYGPYSNKNFNISNISFSSQSIIVFGSPSGVDAWFSKNINISNSIIATIGKTTANRFVDYKNKSIIVPNKSTINHLCEAIYNQLK